MMTFATGQRRNNARAFTLIELILVMTIMIMAVGVVFPSLKGFIHGRNLENEAGQFLSLTRYGQSRAIAEGTPVDLWINPVKAAYGLQSVSGYTETRTNPIVYQVDDSVQMTVSTPPSLLTRSNYWTLASAQIGAMTRIRFQPDGYISEHSPEFIYFRQPDSGAEIRIHENATHLRYEIQNNTLPSR
jgi:Tfp pilus assembly protein FimT